MSTTGERPFHVIGLQQIALGAPDKADLRALWVDRLGLSVVGLFRSERENVDEDICAVGSGLARVEVDLMMPIDAGAKPAVHVPPLNHVGLWIDDLRRAVAWLEANDYRVDYATDWDLQVDPELLAPYALMLSVGHDEYWSDEMRARIEAFIRRGGNVAFFSGNICGYRIHFTDGDTAFTCAKVRPSGKDRGTWEVDNWSDMRPENGVTGTSIRQAGGWWDGRGWPPRAALLRVVGKVRNEDALN